jgi:hypothetical protein
LILRRGGLEQQKTARGTDISRIRWRLGWHGGHPLQPRGSVPPSFDGFTLGSVLLVNHVTGHAAVMQGMLVVP